MPILLIHKRTYLSGDWNTYIAVWGTLSLYQSAYYKASYQMVA